MTANSNTYVESYIRKINENAGPKKITNKNQEIYSPLEGVPERLHIPDENRLEKASD